MIKKLSFAILLLICTTLQVNAQFWNLVWSDEFSGNAVDANNWTFEIGTGWSGWGNNELQYYTSRPENVNVSNGLLSIIGRKENYLGSDYTSTRMITKNKHDWTYGRVEGRIRVPKQQGMWPAFWMLGANISQVSWPDCGEIDIMEHVNTGEKINGTMHWHAGGHAQYGGDTTLTDVNQFHVYSIEWDTQAIRWFVDGSQYHVANIANGINSTQEFHNPFFIIVNMALGGNWPGSPNPSTFVEDTLQIDYIRVYQNQQAPLAQTDVVKDESVSIYPNPLNQSSTAVLSFKEMGAYDIKVLDQLGRSHLNASIRVDENLKYKLDTQELSSGMYYIQVLNGEEVSNLKLLVQ